MKHPNRKFATPPLFSGFIKKEHLYALILIICFGVVGEMDYQDQKQAESAQIQQEDQALRDLLAQLSAR